MSSEAKNKILIVDDEMVNLVIVNKMLSREYDVTTAISGSQAIEFALANKPDLILLDIIMPQMSGIEACRKIKANPSLVNIPVIFLSALDDLADEADGLEVGACDYITKPVKQPILLARVKIHLQNRMYEEFLELLLSNKGQELAAVKEEAQRLREIQL